MKRLPLLFLMMAILPFAPLHAQVHKVDNFPGTGQIMRLVADSSERVIYTERAQGVGSFVFVVDSTVMSFDLPSGMHVNDFELDGWNAYFCGSYGSHGLVGTFNVKEVFFAGDSVSYVWCNSNTTYTNYTIHVSDFTKLDINRTATGISLALIGDAVIDPQYNFNRTVPTSVEFTPGGWKFTYFYNKDGTIHYTDIACLDNVVTAVGYLEASPDVCVVRSFRQVGNFPTQILAGAQGYQFKPSNMYGEPRIVRINTDEAAVVYLWEDNRTAIHQIHVNSTTGVPIASLPAFLVGAAMTVPTAQCWIYDVRFSNGQHKLWILESNDPTGTNSIKNALIGARMFSSGITADVYLLKWTLQLALDIHRTRYLPMTAGYDSNAGNELLYYDPIVSGGASCYWEYQIAPQTEDPVYYPVLSNPDAPSTNYIPLLEPVRVVEHVMDTVCQ